MGRSQFVLADDLLHTADDAVFQHDFDPVRMVGGFGEDSLNGSLCELARLLMLFLDDADP